METPAIIATGFFLMLIANLVSNCVVRFKEIELEILQEKNECKRSKRLAKVDFMQKLKLLPGFVVVGKYEFEFVLKFDSDDSLQLCYSLYSKLDDPDFKISEGWNNPFNDNQLSSFLYLTGGIDSQQYLCEVIDDCLTFLDANGLIILGKEVEKSQTT